MEKQKPDYKVFLIAGVAVILLIIIFVIASNNKNSSTQSGTSPVSTPVIPTSFTEEPLSAEAPHYNYVYNIIKDAYQWDNLPESTTFVWNNKDSQSNVDGYVLTTGVLPATFVFDNKLDSTLTTNGWTQDIYAAADGPGGHVVGYTNSSGKRLLIVYMTGFNNTDKTLSVSFEGN